MNSTSLNRSTGLKGFKLIMEQKNQIAYSDEITYTLLNFAGYGKVESDLWILTFDQTLPAGLDLAKFAEFGQTTSKPEFSTAFEIDGSTFNTMVLNGFGALLAELFLKLTGSPITEFNISKFYEEILLTHDGTGFLIPFYPIPVSPKSNEDFQERFPLFKSYSDYLSKAKKLRGEFIQELLAQFAPKTVIALMDKEHFIELKDVFPQFHFEDHAGIYAGWDTTTILLLLDPPNISNDGLDWTVKFILENSLPMDLVKKSTNNNAATQGLTGTDSQKPSRPKTQSKRRNKAKHDPSDPYCVCDECLGY